MITPGVGYTFTNSSQGASLLIDQQIITESRPFSVYQDSTPQGDTVFRIIPGIFNGIFPTVNGVSIDQPHSIPAPQSTRIVLLTVPNNTQAGVAFGVGSIITLVTTYASSDSNNLRIPISSINVETLANGLKNYTIQNTLAGSLSGYGFTDFSTGNPVFVYDINSV